MNMYPQMETPGGTCTPKQKYEWACCVGLITTSNDEFDTLFNRIHCSKLARTQKVTKTATIGPPAKRHIHGASLAVR